MGRVRTDGSGRFYFPGLANGRYTIKVLPLGTNLQEHSEDVELAGLGSRGQSLPDNQQKDIYLKSRRGSATPFSNQVIYAQEVPKDAQSLYNYAVADLDNQRVDLGGAGLEKAIAAFPTYFAALLRLGTVRLAEQKFDPAITLFERALAVNQRCFDCYYGIAYSNYALRKYNDAIVSSEKALNETRDSIDANLLLGMAARNTKNHKKAEEALLRASKISDGRNGDVHWQLALLYGRDLERYAEAAKELELYLKASPEAPNKEDVKKLIKQFKDQAKVSR